MQRTSLIKEITAIFEEKHHESHYRQSYLLPYWLFGLLVCRKSSQSLSVTIEESKNGRYRSRKTL